MHDTGSSFDVSLMYHSASGKRVFAILAYIAIYAIMMIMTVYD